MYLLASLGMLIFFVFNNFLVYVVFKNKNNASKANKILRFLAIYIILYKISEYTYWQIKGLHYKIPIEFSALSYFIFGISVLTNWKPLLNIATYCAFIAGISYYIGFIISPTSFIHSPESPFLKIFAFINHSIIYFSGMLLLTNRTMQKSYFGHLFFAQGLMLGYSYLMVYLTKTPERVILLDICEGRILDGVVDYASISGYFIYYYVAFIGLLASSFFLIYYLNKLLYTKLNPFEKNIIDESNFRQTVL